MNNSHAFLWSHGDLVTKAWLDVNSRPSEGGTVCRVFNAQSYAFPSSMLQECPLQCRCWKLNIRNSHFAVVLVLKLG